MSPNIKIAPSILSSDFSRLGQEIECIDGAGADYIHIDVMDGHFVPNLTFGPPVIEKFRRNTQKIFDVHLMIAPAAPHLEAYAKAGADIITVHAEAETHVHRSLQAIKAMGKKAGIALNPATPACAVDHVMDLVDLILVMTVNPGFGGQSFINVCDKIAAIKEKIDATGRDIDLEVDGGITPETAPLVKAAGANVLVAGTAIFKDGPAHYKEYMNALRDAA